MAATVTTCEVGLFSTPEAPKKVGQSLTKLIIAGGTDSITSTGVKRSAALSTQIAAGVHLWAGIRIAATTPGAIWGLSLDMSQGHILSTTGGSAFSNSGPWTGALIAASTSAVCPGLRVAML
jgi:hypothetical protein